MRLPTLLAAVSLAFAVPALAQTSSNTTTTGGTTPQPTTTISGGLGEGTVSAVGIAANPAQDEILMRQIVAELANDPAMQGAQIDVQVVGGRVTLNGITLGPAQAEAARSIAQGIAGSVNVSSNLSNSRQ
jgi:hypothetical protein